MSDTTDFLAPLVSAYEATVSQANAVAAEVQNANEGSQSKSIKEFRENSDHPAAVSYREFYEKLQNALLKRREEIAKIAAEELKFKAPLTDAERKAKREEYKPLAANAKKNLTLIKSVAETLHIDVPAVTPLVNFGSGKPAGERVGSTGTKTRWSKVEYQQTAPEKGDLVTVKRLSDFVIEVKRVTGVTFSASDISAAIFEEAGTDDPNKITDVSIVWSATPKDGETVQWDLHVYRDPKTEEVASDLSDDSDDDDDDSEDDDTEE
jgi:hypothetical protein